MHMKVRWSVTVVGTEWLGREIECLFEQDRRWEFEADGVN